MQKQTRRALFYFLVLLFSAATPFIILYALGYIPDIASWRFTPTGGLFVKTNEPGITVSINGRVERETNFLTRGALVTNLPAGMISVEVTKEGFLPWRKSVEIERQVVQEFPFILLVPESMKPLIIAGTTTASNTASVPRALIPDPGNKYLLWVTESGKITTLSVIDKASGKDLRNSISLKGDERYETAVWSPDGTAFFIVAAAKNGKRWYLASAAGGESERLFDPTKTLSLTASATSTAPTLLRLRLEDIKDVAWDPSATGGFLLHDGEKLYRWDRRELFARPVADSVAAFAVFPDEVLFINRSGFFGRADLDGSNAETLDRPGFFINDDRAPQITKNKNGVIVVSDSSGGIYTGKREAMKLAPVAGNISRVKFSPNKDLIGYTENGKLMVRFLEDEKRQPFRPQDSSHRILDAIVPINDFVWFDRESAHIVFTTKNGVFIAETDNRFDANATTLKTGQFLIAEDPSDPNSFYLTEGKTIERVTID
ncbi:MAG: hypothetical protein UY71_C0012G0002 [Parcubacteria group bacterium GW2011_GWB1_52_7]|nr:MAG: hypothetical protein UY71_C0012G0002 [Parcubacteria group bacterium GW2011_GWB1_52_7]KKW30979.1 MAG: hypothetical protein UY75_C0018G0009 [Parcubacteria group bacterium GW2011_GWC2_52_8c]